jgi:hypothetical protein
MATTGRPISYLRSLQRCRRSAKSCRPLAIANVIALCFNSSVNPMNDCAALPHSKQSATKLCRRGIRSRHPAAARMKGWRKVANGVRSESLPALGKGGHAARSRLQLLTPLWRDIAPAELSARHAPRALRHQTCATARQIIALSQAPELEKRTRSARPYCPSQNFSRKNRRTCASFESAAARGLQLSRIRHTMFQT